LDRDAGFVLVGGVLGSSESSKLLIERGEELGMECSTLCGVSGGGLGSSIDGDRIGGSKLVELLRAFLFLVGILSESEGRGWEIEEARPFLELCEDVPPDFVLAFSLSRRFSIFSSFRFSREDSVSGSGGGISSYKLGLMG